MGEWLRDVSNAFSSAFSSLNANDTVRLSFRCSLVSNAVFWITSLFCLWADHLAYCLVIRGAQSKPQSKLTIRTKALMRLSYYIKSCKLQPNRFIIGKDRIDLVRLAFINMVLVACFVCCPLFGYTWDRIINQRKIQGKPYEDFSIVWKQEVFGKLPIHALLAEVSFYVVHGFLHWSPTLYKKIHKVHHRFVAPTAMACVYAHPLEFAIGNVLPIYLGPMVCDSHPMTCYIWWGLAMLGTCKGHSGYRIFGHKDDHEEQPMMVLREINNPKSKKRARWDWSLSFCHDWCHEKEWGTKTFLSWDENLTDRDLKSVRPWSQTPTRGTVGLLDTTPIKSFSPTHPIPTRNNNTTQHNDTRLHQTTYHTFQNIDSKHKVTMSTEGLPIKCKAMVARAPKAPLVEEEITVMPPKAGEVRVKVISNAREYDPWSFPVDQ